MPPYFYAITEINYKPQAALIKPDIMNIIHFFQIKCNKYLMHAC
jgi:hypothetical protein